MRVEAPASAAVSVSVAAASDGGTPTSITPEEARGDHDPLFPSRSASLRKRIVSFVFDKTRKHGRFMARPGLGTTGIRLRRRALERTTV